MLLLLALACTTSPPLDTGPDTVPWSGAMVPASSELDAVRGLVPLRTIVHLHSPWSHDACDGHGWEDGELDEACLADLRAGLCATAVDVAFLTDHPAHAAEQAWQDLFLQRADDAWIGEVASEITCPGGHVVTWRAGIEDVLMPVGLERHAGASAAENDAIYNSSEASALAAERGAGATVLMAHTEGKELAELERLQDDGLAGVEVFNLHAMFAPDKREDDLGLDPYGWMSAIAPFTSPEGTAEPDLFFLGVLQEQAPSIAKWDALLARGPSVGVSGTDAHQNVLPLDLRDGERGDSYRRMLRWFSTMVLAEGRAPAQVDEALAAGRAYVAFDVLGRPAGFDVHVVDAQGAVHEMGSTAPPGTLNVACPTLAPSSPRGDEAPEITVTVFRDGAPWQTDCGAFPVEAGHVYRVRVDLLPRHLRPFLGDDPEPWMKPFPWVYSNAIRVTG